MTGQVPWYRQYFWSIAFLFVAIKLFLVSDVAVHIRFSPFDDSLYVSRAHAFLTDGNWGSYDAYVLAKLPGMSQWLVATRLLGIPYLVGINLLYCLAGLLLLRAAAKAGVGERVLLIAYLAFLCNPVTFSVGWALVMREALSSVLTIALLGISLHILVTPKHQLPWGWILGWALLFAFGQLLREEDRLLWGFLLLFGGAAVWNRYDFIALKFDHRFAILLFAVPTLLTLAAGYGLRSYNQAHYGAPILSDYSEGEFPRLMATLRSIDSPVDNRLVMLPQEVIQRLRVLVPDFVPVLDRLPAPGLQTYSCKMQGVCSEWSNGWMPWWVKQASAEAGLTPTLPAGQAYYKSIREQIEALCGANKLSCHPNGQGIIPPMQLRWFRAYAQEFVRVTAMLIYPQVELVSANSQPVNAARSLVEKYQYVTMTSVTDNPHLVGNNASDTVPKQAMWRGTLALIDAVVVGMAFVVGTVALVWRWVMYPGVPASPVFKLCVVFWVYSAVRLLALAYVAVFLGPFEPRIVFATYTGLSVLGILAVWDLIQAHKQFQSLRYGHA